MTDEVIDYTKQCARGQCHGRLNQAVTKDADPVVGSHSTYCFLERNPQGEGDLKSRTFSCACKPCRQWLPDLERKCELLSVVGRWKQNTCFSQSAVLSNQQLLARTLADFSSALKGDELVAVKRS